MKSIRPFWLLLAAAIVLVLPHQALGVDHTVTLNSDNTFSPEVLDIAIGDTVTWTNAGGLHNVDAPGFFRCANGCDDTGGNGDPALPPWSFTRTFDEQVSIGYNCVVHLGLGMTGVVNVDGGRATLAISGECPGDVIFNAAGFTPGASVALLFSPTAGSFEVPSGNCAGTELGLGSPSLLSILPADDLGSVFLERTLPAAGCGSFIQLLDLSSCDTTEAAQIP